jgi:hypothetical protein
MVETGKPAMRSGSMRSGGLRWLRVWMFVSAIAMLGAVSAQAAPSTTTPLEPPIVEPTVTPTVTSDPSNLHPLVPVAEYRVSRAEAEASQSAEAVEYYEKHFNVSSQVARSRLATQAMGSGLASVLRSKMGDAASEVWFDNTTGEWVVDVATTETAAVSAATASEGISGFYRVQHVEYTRSDLLNAEHAVISQLSTPISSGQAQVGTLEGKINLNLASGLSDEETAIDREVNATTAVMPGAPPVVVTSASNESLEAGGTVRCLFPFCDTLIAGDMYGTYGEKGENYTCTMAWWAGYEGLNAVEHPLMLTAGHCSLLGRYQGADVSCLPYPGGCAEVGINAGWYYGSDGDWSAIAVSYPPSSGWDPGLNRPYGGYVNWNSDGISTLKSYYSSGPAPTGMVICHQGYGSGVDLGDGSQCGTIARNNVTVKYSYPVVTTLEHMSEVTGTEACPGDSGGPWDGASYEVAVGIDSGTAAPDGSCGSTAYMTPVYLPVVSWKLILYGG